MDYVIITFSGFHYFISEAQEEKLKKLPLNATIELEEGSVNTKSIAEVVSKEKYYERFPDKRPEPKPINFSKLLKPKKTYSKDRREKRLRSMKEGFLKGVAKKRGVESVTYEDLKSHQKEMYDHMENALESVEKGRTPHIVGMD